MSNSGMTEGTASRHVRGPQKTTRDDWIAAALDTLISDGVEHVRVQDLGKKLDCARSSFYGYFRDREALLEALLDFWQAKNTRAIVRQSSLPAASVNLALVNVFRCWSNDELFDSKLDFAVREWARRSGSVRRAVDISDDARIGALASMFQRYDYPEAEALVRARIVYFTQIGYNALDIRESLLQRARVGPEYLYCHTGVRPSAAEIAAVVGLTGFTPEDIR